MNKEFVTYEQAKALKELGFDEPCLAGYNFKDGRKGQFTYPSAKEPNTTSKARVYNQDKKIVGAPLYQQAFRWFREKYSLIASPVWRIDNTWDMNIQKLDNNGLLSGQSTLAIIKKPTYEEAEQACLDKLIEICKNK